MEGKRALVTGAGRGIGLAIAKALANDGAKVMLSDVDASTAEESAAGIEGAAATPSTDVTDSAAVKAAVDATVEAFGGLDIIVNNAGIEVSKPLVETGDDEFNRLMAINVSGVFYGIKHATPALAAAGGGSIINMASIAGLGGSPLLGAYTASKAAVLNLTRTAAVELREANIRVNAVCPGFIQTQMVDNLRAPVEALTGLGFDELAGLKQVRLGTVEEVAEAVRFLASDELSWTTGSHYILDNGLSGGLL